MNGIIEVEIPEIEGLQETFVESIEHCNTGGGEGHC
jgi:hypothetical protein